MSLSQLRQMSADAGEKKLKRLSWPLLRYWSRV